jgi:hypothetical protein
MHEGTIVIITGKFDERVRKNKENNVIGTVVGSGDGEVWVMLPDGNIWVGKEYLVYPYNEEQECTTN